MGKLILCTHRTASKPYEIADGHINIYTIEELCYYLDENVTVLEDSFFNENLCDWISMELGDSDLADGLWNLICRMAPFSEMVLMVFEQSKCYLPEEIAAIEETLNSLKGKNLLERKKIRVDHQLDKKEYSMCIRAYEKMLEDDIPMTKEFQGGIRHNLGVAYAGMFMFIEAAECFAKAYKLNHKEESRKCYYYTLQLVSPEQQIAQEDLGAGFDELIKYKDEFHQLEADLAVNGQLKVFQTAAEMKTSLEKRELLLNLLYDWKKKYRKM